MSRYEERRLRYLSGAGGVSSSSSSSSSAVYKTAEKTAPAPVPVPQLEITRQLSEEPQLLPPFADENLAIIGITSPGYPRSDAILSTRSKRDSFNHSGRRYTVHTLLAHYSRTTLTPL